MKRLLKVMGVPGAGIVSAALLLGVAGAQGAGSGTAGPGGVPVNGMVWELQVLTDHGGAVTLPAGIRNPSVQFAATSASGSAGCNTFRGGYASRGDVLRFGPLATTRMSCPPNLMALESRYLNLLKDTTRFGVSGSVLTLYAGTQGKLVFRLRSGAKPAQPPVTQPSVTQPPVTQPVPVKPVPVKPPVAPVPGQGNAVRDGVTGVTWTLVSVNGSAVRTARPVTFRVQGARVTGTDGCNSFGGPGKVAVSGPGSGTVLATGPLVSTEMACLPDAGGVPSLPGLLRSGAAYRVSGGTLTLSTADATLTFTGAQPGGPTPPTGTTAPATTLPTADLPDARTPFDTVTPTGLGPDEDLFIVGDRRVPCQGVGAGECLLVKHPGETAWSVFHGNIEGFAFQGGVTSLLKLSVQRVAVPAADGSNVRYRLVQVVRTFTPR